MKVILINGKKQHGKNTVADFIKKYIPLGKSSIEVGNADAVKYVCRSIYGWDSIKDDKGNRLLIDVTDAGYYYDPYFWEKKSHEAIERFKALSGRYPDYVIVPDWRYQCTYDYWSDLAMKNEYIEVATINVYRPKFNSKVSNFVKNDKSENGLDDFPFDYKVCNDGSLDSLRYAVKIITENINKV